MSDPAPPVLDLRDLTVRLPAGADRENAVEGVSFTVKPREILCVVGESGSGKSVTAHTVMGLLPRKQLRPTAGRILLQGEDLLQKSPAALRDLRGARMSMIFQEPMTALNPVMRIGEQIEEVLQIHTGMSARERRTRVIEVMDAVKLPRSSSSPTTSASWPRSPTGSWSCSTAGWSSRARPCPCSRPPRTPTPGC